MNITDYERKSESGELIVEILTDTMYIVIIRSGNKNLFIRPPKTG
jgi:hypothetical protein